MWGCTGFQGTGDEVWQTQPPWKQLEATVSSTLGLLAATAAKPS